MEKYTKTQKIKIQMIFLPQTPAWINYRQQ